MSAYLLDAAAIVRCSHGGLAHPSDVAGRVLLNGVVAITSTASYLVVGCPLTTGGLPTPCTGVAWLTAATRVTTDGQPLVLGDSVAITSPDGTPAAVVPAQSRVTGN